MYSLQLSTLLSNNRGYIDLTTEAESNHRLSDAIDDSLFEAAFAKMGTNERPSHAVMMANLVPHVLHHATFLFFKVVCLL